jgi:maltose alpha-D-glucosyltransferase/alpha-amylase
MQWSMDRNGGFSRADPARLVLPPVMDPLYGYQAVNVEAQARDPHSLLNWTRRVLAVRKRYKAFGRGSIKFLYPGNRKILAYLREYEDEHVLCVANMSRTLQAVELDLGAFEGRVPVEIVGGTTFPPIGRLPYLLTLPPFGFYGFQLCANAQMPPWHQVPAEPMPDFETLVLRGPLVEGPVMAHHRGALERDVLPTYLGRRRWFGAKDRGIRTITMMYSQPWPDRGEDLVISEIEAWMDDGSSERYCLPLGIIWEDENPPARAQQLALARVRRGRRVGYLTDGFVLDAFVSGLLRGLRQRLELPLKRGGSIRFTGTAALDAIDFPIEFENRWLSAEQSNSSVIVHEHGMLKLYRHIAHGINPELEMGRHLTRVGYAHTPPLLGEVLHVGADGVPSALAVLQGFVRNQGDAWRWTLDYLLRTWDEFSHAADDAARAEILADYDSFAAAVGTRLGELHAVLAQPSDDEAFQPVTAGGADVESWAADARAQLQRATEALAALDTQDAALREQRERLLQRRPALERRIDSLARHGKGALRTRVHGDFHLGQVLVVQGDAWLIDFEGEPARPLQDRRIKTTPLRDVAGFLRSLDYVAAVALRGEEGVAPIEDPLFPPFLERFRLRASEVFLAAYMVVLERAPVRWISAEALVPMLELFLLDKAAYEIAYEAANRPGWLGVPLQGLLRLTDEAAIGRAGA